MNIDRTLKIRIVTIIILIAWAIYANAQKPPHPNGGGAPGTTKTVVRDQPAGAPAGSGNIRGSKVQDPNPKVEIPRSKHQIGPGNSKFIIGSGK